MLISTITQKGQVTIPKKIRDTLHLKANDRVIFVKRGNSVIIKPVKDVLSLRGSIKVDSKQNYPKIRENVKLKIAEKTANE